MALSLMLVGVGLLMAAWVLPMLSDHLPNRVQIVLLVGGLSLIVVGVLISVRAARHKHEARIHQSAS
jgi:ABC-type uncharacterized transport system permease subunit